MRREQPQTAEAFWKRALELKPDFFEVHNNLGIYYAGRKEWKLAREHFEELVKLRPHDVIALGNAAQLCMLAGDYEAADRHVTRGLAISPNDAVLRKAAAAIERRRW